MDKETRKIAVIKIEQTIHWEEISKGHHKRVIDNNIALIDTDIREGKPTTLTNVQDSDKETFLEKLTLYLRGKL